MQMKQKSSIALPCQIVSATQAPIEDWKSIDILNIALKTTAIMDTAKKKKFLNYILVIKEDLLSHARNLDESGQTKTMEKDLEASLPATQRMVDRDWKVDILGTKIVQLYKPLEATTNFLKEKFLAQSQCGTVTRSSVLEALERIENVMRVVDLAVIEKQTKSLYSAF